MANWIHVLLYFLQENVTKTFSNIFNFLGFNTMNLSLIKKRVPRKNMTFCVGWFKHFMRIAYKKWKRTPQY